MGAVWSVEDEYLIGEEMGTLKMFVEVKGDKTVEFGNDTIALGPIVAVASWVVGAELTEVFRVLFVEMISANPELVESTEKTTKLGKFLCIILEWVLRGP